MGLLSDRVLNPSSGHLKALTYHNHLNIYGKWSCHHLHGVFNHHFRRPPHHHQGPGTMLSSSTSGDYPLHNTGGRFYMETICPRSWNSTSKLSSAYRVAKKPWIKWSVQTAVLAWNAHSLPRTPWSALCRYGKLMAGKANLPPHQVVSLLTLTKMQLLK